MAKHPRIQRRSSRYVHRTRIPVDLVDFFGRTEVVKSLGTNDKREALRLGRIRDAEIERMFADARDELSTEKIPEDYLGDVGSVVRPQLHSFMSKDRRANIQQLAAVPRPLARLSAGDAAGIAAAFVARRMHLFAEQRRGEGYLEPWQIDEQVADVGGDLGEAQSALASNDYESVARLAESLLCVNRRSADRASSEWVMLCEYILRAEIEIARRVMASLHGELGVGCFDRLFAEVDDEGQLRQRPAGQLPHPGAPTICPEVLPGALTLGSIIDRFNEERDRAQETPAAGRGRAIAFRLLREEIGDSRPADKISPEDFKEIRKLIPRLPTNAAKRFPGIRLRDAADLAEKKGLPTISQKTIANHWTVIIALFGYAEREALIAKNLARGSRPKRVFEPGSGREPFKIEKLNRLFEAPIFTGCVDDEINWAKSGEQHPRRARFWAAPISLFTGMRLGEILQLEEQDVQDRDGVWGIEVTSVRQHPDTLKHLKSKSAHRFIPLHAELIQIGFLDFVRQQRLGDSMRLFPEARPYGRSGYSDPYQKWFSRLLKRMDVYSPRTTFHSIRHSWRDALRNADVPEERARELGGWSGSGSLSEHYGSGTHPAILQEEINKVEYPGLDFTRLHIEPTPLPPRPQDRPE